MLSITQWPNAQRGAALSRRQQAAALQLLGTPSRWPGREDGVKMGVLAVGEP